jgi:serine/threonine protein kinase
MADFEMRDEIILHDELGRGSYGKVCIGDWKGTPVAVKMINSDGQLSSEAFTGFLEKFVEEWRTLKSLRHPNILQFFGVCSPDSDHPKMVMELMHENLYHRLRDGPSLSHAARLYVLRSVACGLRYMHELPEPVVHRDLSSKNILLSRDATQVKIGDLGVAKALEDLQSVTGTVTAGTELYTPPEVRCDCPTRPSVDIFSYGVIAIETLTGRPPAPLPLLVPIRGLTGQFRTLPEVERRRDDLNNIARGHPMRAMICQCLDEASRRPTASRILKWFDLSGRHDLRRRRAPSEHEVLRSRETENEMGEDSTDTARNNRQSRIVEVQLSRQVEALELQVERERDSSASALMRLSVQGTIRDLSYRSQMSGVCRPVPARVIKGLRRELRLWRSVPGLPVPQNMPPMTMFDNYLVIAENQSESLHFIDLDDWGVAKTAKYWNSHMSFQSLLTHSGHLFAVMWNRLTWRYRIEEYLLDGDTWSPVADMPEEIEVSNSSIVASGEKLFLLGGCTRNNEAIDNVWMYDIGTSQWEVIPCMPIRRSCCSSVIVDDQLCVGGGVLPDGTGCNEFCMMSIERHQWLKLTSTSNYACGLGQVQGLPLAVGGRTDKRKKKTASAHVEVFDYNLEVWLPLPPVPTPRYQPSLLTTQIDLLIVAGGANKQGDQSTIEVLNCRDLTE